MKWLYVTIGLLTTCVCLVGWIYLRDRDTNWRPPEPQLARADATVALGELPRRDCRHGCQTKVLGGTGPHRWLVRITVKGRTRCIQINLDTITANRHRVAGVQPSRCASHPTDRTR